MKHKYFSLIFLYIPLGLSKRLFYHEGVRKGFYQPCLLLTGGKNKPLAQVKHLILKKQFWAWFPLSIQDNRQKIPIYSDKP
jgi:hypothetical protein